VLSSTPGNIQAGFIRTGIHPLNPNFFTDASLDLSRPHETDNTLVEAWSDVASRFFKDGNSRAESIREFKSGLVDTKSGCHVTIDAVIAMLEHRATNKKKLLERKTQALKDSETEKESREAARVGRAAETAARAATRLDAAEAAEKLNLRGIASDLQDFQAKTLPFTARRAARRGATSNRCHGGTSEYPSDPNSYQVASDEGCVSSPTENINMALLRRVSRGRRPFPFALGRFRSPTGKCTKENVCTSS